MKKSILITAALAALAMLVSCQKEQLIETPAATTGVTEFTASIEQPTKTAIDAAGKVTWVAGDSIVVTDAAKKSAVYIAESGGASTKFTIKNGETPVGDGPYTATYGDINKQVYDAAGANCPLAAPQTSTTNFTFSSPYAVVEITAKSSNAEAIDTVVVNYGGRNYILDCGDGVALTTTGNDFYIAVQPSAEAAALSVTLYTADKMATKERTSAVTLAAKDLIAVTFDSFDWDKKATFKAVYNSGDRILTFYYDDVDHSEEGDVYENGTEDFLFDDTQDGTYKWGWPTACRLMLKSVVIDASVAGYPFLTSTSYMFFGMKKVTSISGVEYLNVSCVTDMSYMFKDMVSLNVVPNVSGWDTGNVTAMNQMFYNCGEESTVLTDVPDVSGWNTGNVTNMHEMFCSYGWKSQNLNKVPDVSKWDTGNVTDMGGMFKAYGYNSQNLNVVPNVSKWNTGNVTDMNQMFCQYGGSSTTLNIVPDVSGWNTGNVTDMSYMFEEYGCNSQNLNTVPNVSKWNTGNVTDMSGMFRTYGKTSENINCELDLSGWSLAKLEKGSELFKFTPKTFNVTIPAKTGEKDNDTDHWYYNNGTDSVSPPSGKSFTLAE